MKFERAPLEGAWVIEVDPSADPRGWFARTFCLEEFAAHGIDMRVAQANASFNLRAGTLRGMHYQAPPHGERKVVRCTRGAIYDVIVDVRPVSATYLRWFAAELTADNGRMLYVPEGFAHGFQTLVEASEVSYLMSRAYVSEAAQGLRWDDPALAIEWPPVAERTISERDRRHPVLSS